MKFPYGFTRDDEQGWAAKLAMNVPGKRAAGWMEGRNNSSDAEHVRIDVGARGQTGIGVVHRVDWVALSGCTHLKSRVCFN
jgi:hypothetical protein